MQYTDVFLNTIRSIYRDYLPYIYLLLYLLCNIYLDIFITYSLVVYSLKICKL